MSTFGEDIEEPRLTTGEKRDVDIRRNIVKGVTILSIIFLFLVILRFTLGDEIENTGIWIVERFGYPGMFFATLLMDTFIVPISPDVIIFVSIAGKVNVFWALFTITVASMLGGNLGYMIGRFLHRLGPVKRLIQPYEARGHYLMKKYGLWAVIVGAMTPIPFSTVCWTAGMLEMKYWHFLAGVSWRIPRFIMWYIILKAGFTGI